MLLSNGIHWYSYKTCYCCSSAFNLQGNVKMYQKNNSSGNLYKMKKHYYHTDFTLVCSQLLLKKFSKWLAMDINSCSYGSKIIDYLSPTRKCTTEICRSLSLQHHCSQSVCKKYRKSTSFRNITHPTPAQEHFWVKELILWISQCMLHIVNKKLHSLKLKLPYQNRAPLPRF